MPRLSPQVIAAALRAGDGGNAPADVHRLARDIQDQLAGIPEEQLVAMIDAAIINAWGAATSAADDPEETTIHNS